VGQPPNDHVRVSKPRSQAAAASIVVTDQARRELAGLFERTGECFARIEPRLQAKKYVRACMSNLEKRNGWSIGEYIGDVSPNKTQRLLSKAAWNEDGVMREIRRHVVTELDSVATRRSLRILALDETGQEKKGDKTSGCQRQYMGCAGRVSNGINTVHLSYIRPNAGHSLIGFRQWIPEEQLKDPEKATRTRLPDDLEFATKGQLGAQLIRETHEDGISADFVTGDEVYGASPDLRGYCEETEQGYVLRVACTFPITLGAGTTLTGKQIVHRHLKANRRWKVASAGPGSKGERLYAWAWIATASPQHFLLIRRHIKTGECAYHYCFVPETQKPTLARLIAAAGLRWPIEECFEFGKDYFGLDQSQVRLAARTRQETNTQMPPPTSPDQKPPANPGLIPLTIREIKHLFNAMTTRPSPTWLTAHWSRWRRRHQARARWFHQRARLAPNLKLAQVRP